MTLGLTLLGGTIVIYASSKNSYLLQENVAGLQENARFVMLALRRDIEMAGFPGNDDINPFLTIAPNETSDGGGENSDQITIRYQSATDCLGSATPNNGIDQGIAVNHYFINNDNNLACLGNGNVASQPLVENIDNMQILYGVDTDNGDGVANLYASATRVNTGIVNVGTPDWDRVVSVRVALLVASDTAINSPAPGNTFTLLDAPTITRNDGHLYRVFTTTIPLRNRIL